MPEKADAPVMRLHIRLLARSEEVTKVKERQGEIPWGKAGRGFL